MTSSILHRAASVFILAGHFGETSQPLVSSQLFLCLASSAVLYPFLSAFRTSATNPTIFTVNVSKSFRGCCSHEAAVRTTSCTNITNFIPRIDLPFKWMSVVQRVQFILALPLYVGNSCTQHIASAKSIRLDRILPNQIKCWHAAR